MEEDLVKPDKNCGKFVWREAAYWYIGIRAFLSLRRGRPTETFAISVEGHEKRKIPDSGKV